MTAPRSVPVPCRWCESRGVKSALATERMEPPYSGFRVTCYECEMTGPEQPSIPEAVTSWNTLHGSPWRRVGDGLPEDRSWNLVAAPGHRRPVTAQFFDSSATQTEESMWIMSLGYRGYLFASSPFAPTHWMPMPELPREEE